MYNPWFGNRLSEANSCKQLARSGAAALATSKFTGRILDE